MGLGQPTLGCVGSVSITCARVFGTQPGSEAERGGYTELDASAFVRKRAIRRQA
jgi:hypothetical protein